MKKALLTTKQVRGYLAFRGWTIDAFARVHGFKPQQVEDVLRGKAKGKFGQSHAIAVTLGLKHGVIEALPSAPAR
jgi:gp16 family phage-associated protein